MTCGKARWIVQRIFTWLSFLFCLCTIVGVRISCLKMIGGWGGFHSWCFFFLFFLQWCVLHSCVCVCEGGISGVGLLCQEGGSGGWAGSMDIKPDSTGTGALASEWAKVCTIVKSPSPAYGRSGGRPQTGPRVSRGLQQDPFRRCDRLNYDVKRDRSVRLKQNTKGGKEAMTRLTIQGGFQWEELWSSGVV